MTTEQKIIYRLMDMADNMRSVANDLEKVREVEAAQLKGAAYIADDWVKCLKEELEKKV